MKTISKLVAFAMLLILTSARNYEAPSSKQTLTESMTKSMGVMTFVCQGSNYPYTSIYQDEDCNYYTVDQFGVNWVTQLQASVVCPIK